MKMPMFTVGVAVLLLTASGAGAAGHSEAEINQLKIKLMQETKLIAVMEINGPADKYLSDGDPNSLEIVFLSKPEDGPSRVSDDGEVIFLSENVTDEEQQTLTAKAFDIRAMRQLSSK